MEYCEEAGWDANVSSAATHGTTGAMTPSFSCFTNQERFSMNARTKRAKRAAQTQQSGIAALATQGEAATSTSVVQGAKVVTKPVSDPCCVNPACRRKITSLTKYGSHGGGWTCCRDCDDIMNPVSAAIRRSRRETAGSFVGNV